MWLERIDAHIGTSTDGTVCSAGWHAGEICLRSKQESPKCKGSGPPQELYYLRV